MIPVPSILDRSTGYLTLQWRNDPDILGYRVRVADSLDNAYGPFNGVVPTAGAGTEAIFDVNRGQTLRTKAIRLKGTGISGDITRGQTRATYNPNEFFDPPTTAVVPPDNQLIFMRIQVRTTANPVFPGGAFPGTANATDQSKILIVQDPRFFEVPRPALTLHGTTPAIAGAVPGLPAPPESLIFGVPAFADAMVITNHDVANPLYFAASPDQPLMQIDPSTSISHASGMKDELVFVSTANVAFSVIISSVTGMR
jgi:hypothetical protein